MEETNNDSLDKTPEQDDLLQKSKKPRTKAQQEAFDKVKQKRLENINIRKEQLLPLKAEINKINKTKAVSKTTEKPSPIPPIENKIKKIKIPLEESDDSEEEEIVIVRHKPKKKTKKVVYLEDSEDEEVIKKPVMQRQKTEMINPIQNSYNIKFV